MNNSLIVLAMLCVSPIESHGNITIVNRLPAGCTQVLGSPPLPDPVMPISEMPYNATEKPLEAKPAAPVTTPAKKVKKPAKRARCKPGRTRNAKGICGRWR
jgi:hypothetical protein